MKRDYSYRKIWQNANGKIPIDDTGMSYEIHHLDKNHKNNPIRAKEWKISYKGEILNIKKFCRDNDLGYGRLFNGTEVNGYKILKDLI